MRLEHVEFRLDQQLETLEFIRTAYDNLIQVGTYNVTTSRIETRLAALNEYWEKFQTTNDAIGIAIRQLSPREKEKILTHRYFMERVFQATQEHYLEAVERMNSLLSENRRDDRRSVPSYSPSRSLTGPSIIHQGPRLPRIDLPKFDGTPSDWLSFKDLFYSLVSSNPTLSPVEKLQYLKTSLIGSAVSLLKNTALTADNFQKAWDALVSFYENKRLLVNAALHSLVTLKRMTKESASEMEHLYANIMQIYRNLEALQRPVQQWDDFLVFTAVQRLDSESVKAWEHHLGPSREPPTWKQFSDFLMTRMLSLQAFEKSRQGRPVPQHHPHHARTHHAGKVPDHQASKQVSCPFCSSDHYAASCPQYVSKTVDQRIDMLKKNRLCYNCLGHHQSSACPSSRRCGKCGKKHHSSTHKAKASTSTESSATPTTSQVNHASMGDPISSSITLLPTAQVTVVSEKGEKITARALIDPGSQISFISERLVQQLHLPRRRSSTVLHGIGAVKAGRTKGTVSVTLTSRFDDSAKCSLLAHILPTLTALMPAVQIKKGNWPHLKGLTLADPEFTSPGRIDIIIGSDYYGNIIEEGLRKGAKNLPIAQRTIFGWVISGSSTSDSAPAEAQSFHISADRELHDLLQRFWSLEEFPSSSNSSLSSEEQECEEHFKSTHTRDSNGRYIVRLPINKPVETLGDSRFKAMRMLLSLNRKFQTNSSYQKAYSDFLHEYDSLGHMQRVTSTQEPPCAYYLPHHGVIRESSSTTKLRVVFNGSSKTSTGVSLNDILHTGAKLQIDLLNVLLWFRKFRYVFSSDIEKMYRQIKVHPSDWDLQRILWITNSRQIETFQLTTVTYGLACAPFLALRSLLQLVNDEGERFPLAVAPLTQRRYVDNVFGGADSVEQAQEVARQTNQLAMAGGFPLRKWVSNHAEILQNIPPESRANLSSIIIDEDTVVHALGLRWSPHADTFNFSIQLSAPKSITKRTILSIIAQIFDPLGLLAPVIIRAKVFMQELWSIKLDWDDPLPPHLTNTWLEFFHQLDDLSQLSFPRWLGFGLDSSLEIHGFCDASQQAIAAVAYIRSLTNGNVQTAFVCAKTKVAPLKRLTIPRLELSGAVLLTKLVAHLIKTFQLSQTPVYLWTDSAIVYTWLNNHPSRWKEFVHNRVCYIQESLPHANWRFIPGKENPADCATRGLTPSQLLQHEIWWTGPCWLKQPSSLWPVHPQQLSTQENLEERSAQIHAVTSSKPSSKWDLPTRYSTLTRLLRVTATCQRFIARLRKVPESSLAHPLTAGDINHARNYWIKHLQGSFFRDELKLLSKGEPLPKSSPLSRLTPFVDKFGFLRVGGRLQSSALSTESKHPFILPRDSHITKLIIADAHARTLHGGTQVTLSYIRETFWILGGRAPVRSYILKCVRCARYRQKRAEQLMGQLPSERVTPSRPFLHSGVDYAGPFLLKTWRGRAARSYKSYIALFVCESTSAIHLELVTDYTAEAFIAAYKRFTARRGICATLRSDCGTNLKGADSELKALFSSVSKESKLLASLLSNDGTEWIFNPPAAPHFGGKWEAGVKSVKHHLRRVIGDHVLTYEEMNTLLTQIEAVLNSRPLNPLTDDPEDLSALTPGHFLIGNAPCIIPEPSLEEEKVSRLSRWQHLRQMLDSFWSKWSRECLQRYQAIYKWKQSSNPIKEGSLVLVIDERYPPSKWPLGRVLQLHPGNDGHTRVVTVRTQATTLKRPIVKICPLPIEADTL